MKLGIVIGIIMAVVCFVSLEARSWDKIGDMLGLQQDNQPPVIKVLIVKDANAPLLEVKGGYNVYDPKTNELLGMRLFGKAYVVEPITSGLKWGEEFPGVYQIKIVPDNVGTTILLNGIEYRGTLTVYQIEGLINCVNEVPVEDYVKSVLSEQLDTTPSKEVANAVAIAARTEAYFYIWRRDDAFWHVDAREVSYQGSAVAYKPEIEQAVDATRYLVMRAQGDEQKEHPFAARWTQNCAGKTAPFHVMYRQDMMAPKEGVEAPLAAEDRKASAWSFSVKTEELSRLAKLSNITAAKPFTDKFSGKVYAIRFQDGDQHSDLDFFSLQEGLGRDKLQSSDFTVTLKGDQTVFSGFGKGAGVGLCLYSAEAMASRGSNATQILARFFPNTKVEMVSTLVDTSRSPKKDEG